MLCRYCRLMSRATSQSHVSRPLVVAQPLQAAVLRLSGNCHILLLHRRQFVTQTFSLLNSSRACFRVKGKSVDEVLTIKNSDIAKHLSLPPVKLHCSMLAEDAIKAAVKDVQAKRAKAAQSKQQQHLHQTEQPDSGEKLAAAVAS